MEVRLELRCRRPPECLRSTSEDETEETELERRREKRPPLLCVGECSCDVRVRACVVGGGAVVAGTGSVFLEKRPILSVLRWVGS
jgi:hypothetical protein